MSEQWIFRKEVGCNNGSIPEIITSSEIGQLFEPMPEGDTATNATGLCDAMLEVFEIAQRDKTSGKCRKHARSYDITVVDERIENLLFSVTKKAPD